MIYEEICSQFEALAHTSRYLDGQFAGISQLLQEAKTWVFVGSGSSFSVAKSGAALAGMHLGRQAVALAAGDLLLNMPRYRALLRDCALIILSRSGETSEAVRCVEGMRQAGIPFRLLTVSCVEGATLSGLSDLALELPWAFDQSVCQTRTVSCLYFACAWWTAKLAGDTGLLSDLSWVLSQGPGYLAQYEKTLEALTQRDWDHVVVLGDAEIAGLCEEGALAFKEICQLPSNHYHLLDVRHGPMVLIGPKTLVVAALSGAQGGYEEALLGDLLQKGAQVVIYRDMSVSLEGVTCLSLGKSIAHAARGIPVIVACQLLAYYKSFVTGVNPDQPDGLTPWIAL